MAEQVVVYLSIMKDSLQEKEEVLKDILAVTKRQEEILNQETVDADAFDETLNKKGKLIKRMQELDNGFESLYQKVSPVLQAEKERFKPEVLELQNRIRGLTDYSVKIQALESRNKTRFADFVAAKRKEIKEFKVSNKTANSYYQNMANQHHQWQSYFMDQKK
ncbi:MAG: flagellar export chaperone FlgN [Butyribacter sp.]|nr:flagellar export chaperone FlgN [bacterium]MDY3853709.1 flagellar export chaperone FlgN [Butyribacter sp.]